MDSFTLDEKTTILKFFENPSPTEVRRKFIAFYNIKGRDKTKYTPYKFQKVWITFQDSGNLNKINKGGRKIINISNEVRNCFIKCYHGLVYWEMFWGLIGFKIKQPSNGQWNSLFGDVTKPAVSHRGRTSR